MIFLIKRNVDGEVVVNHKECCYIGQYIQTSLLRSNVDSKLDLNKEILKYTYRKRGLSQELSQDKINDLVKMYDKFISPVFRPEWLPVSLENETAYSSASTPSSDLARKHRTALKKGKKKKTEPKSKRT